MSDHWLFMFDQQVLNNEVLHVSGEVSWSLWCNCFWCNRFAFWPHSHVFQRLKCPSETCTESFLSGHHTETVTAPPGRSWRTRFQDACGQWKSVCSQHSHTSDTQLGSVFDQAGLGRRVQPIGTFHVSPFSVLWTFYFYLWKQLSDDKNVISLLWNKYSGHHWKWWICEFNHDADGW